MQVMEEEGELSEMVAAITELTQPKNKKSSKKRRKEKIA